MCPWPLVLTHTICVDQHDLRFTLAAKAQFPVSGIFRAGGNSFACERKCRSEIEWIVTAEQLFIVTNSARSENLADWKLALNFLVSGGLVSKLNNRYKKLMFCL